MSHRTAIDPATAQRTTRTTAPTDAVSVAQALERAGLRPIGAPPLELERGWPMPKIPLMLRYRDPAIPGKKRRWWTLHLTAGRRLPFPHRRALRQGTAAWLDGLPAVAQAFPNDLLLDSLSQAASSRTALTLLQTGLEGRSRVEAVRVQIVGYKPTRRCSLRYRLHSGDGRGSTIFGKVLPADLYYRLHNLHRQAAEVGERERWEMLRFARPAGRVGAWKMIWWRRAAGRSLFHLLECEELAAASARVGWALAELHASSLDWRSTHLAVRELATLTGWISAVSRVEPEERSWLEEAHRRLIRGALGSGPITLVPAHRDFYDKQILVDGDRVTVLDLETAALAEPELDVANFLAHLELRRMQGRSFDLESTAEAFLAGYSSRSRPPDRRRLGWYRCSTLTRLACVYALRPRWSGLAEPLRQAARRAVAAVET